MGVTPLDEPWHDRERAEWRARWRLPRLQQSSWQRPPPSSSRLRPRSAPASPSSRWTCACSIATASRLRISSRRISPSSRTTPRRTSVTSPPAGWCRCRSRRKRSRPCAPGEARRCRKQSARIFLIVLGRGRLQYPSKGVDAMIHFVRNRLLPQDQVAVLAFNRATDFTTDRARILDVLERFKRRHEDIEAMFKHQTSGLAGVYGSLEPSSRTAAGHRRDLRGPGGPVGALGHAGAAAGARSGGRRHAAGDRRRGARRDPRGTGEDDDWRHLRPDGRRDWWGCPSMRSCRAACRRCRTWATCTRASNTCAISRARSTSSSSPSRVSTLRASKPTRASPRARTTPGSSSTRFRPAASTAGCCPWTRGRPGRLRRRRCRRRLSLQPMRPWTWDACRCFRACRA